jgi:hypothetical protein
MLDAIEIATSRARSDPAVPFAPTRILFNGVLVIIYSFPLRVVRSVICLDAIEHRSIAPRRWTRSAIKSSYDGLSMVAATAQAMLQVDLAKESAIDRPPKRNG